MPIFRDDAAEKAYSQFMHDLLLQKLNADSIDPPNQYPLLHTAIVTHSLQGCRAVIDYYRERYTGTNSNQDFTFQQAINFKEKKFGYTALHLACQEGNLDFVRILMEEGKAVDYRVDEANNLPLHYAVLNGHKEIVHYLLTKRLLNELLNFLSFNGEYQTVNNSIESGEAAVNTENNDGDTPLMLALGLKVHDEQSANNREEIVNALIGKYYGNTIIEDQDLGKLKRDSYLLMAMRNGLNFSILDKIIKTKLSDINKKNEDGLSALHLAVIDGNLALIQLLLENQADTALKNDQGMTALHLAVAQQNANAEIVEMLLDYTAANGHLDVGDNNNNRALHIAAKQCDPAITALIVDYGANVNLTNNSGETPLMAAVRAFKAMPLIDCDDVESLTEDQKIILKNGDNQFRSYLYLCDYADMSNDVNKSAAEELVLFIIPKKKLTDHPQEKESQENNGRSTAHQITPIKTADLRLPIEDISAASSPASSTRPLNQNTHRKIMRNHQEKTTGFFERLNNYRISLWRKFKSTKMGRFVRRHPYISAGIFTLAVTGFVALCVFAPPVAAHIPILIGVSKALVSMKIISATANILKPIAETVAMNLPVAALALFIAGDTLIRSAYKKITNYFWPPRNKYIIEIGTSELSSNVGLDKDSAPSVKLNRKEMTGHDFKKQQKNSAGFSFVDDYLSIFNCCGNRKAEVKANQHKVVSIKGKEPDRESIESSTSSIARLNG